MSHVIITLTLIFQEASISSDKYPHFICISLIVYVSLLNSYQGLSWLLWIRTINTATTEQLSYALEDLLDQNNILFQSETENLSAYQMNFLKAIVDGIHTKFSSKEVISKYNLGTSANIVRLKNALLQKELIETNGKEIVLADPVFGVWFKKEMLY